MIAAIGDIGIEGTLEARPDQRLVPNAALQDVLNYFLLAGSDDKTKAALKNYLSTKLPPPAVADAMRIGDSYQAYMNAHDELLAAQNLHLQGGSVTASELVRLSTWREQRARLRLRSLDNQVVQAWYPNEDLQLTQTIDELQRSGEDDTGAAQAQDAAAASGTPFRPVPHWNNKADQERHQEYLLGVITRSITSFDTLKRASQ